MSSLTNLSTQNTYKQLLQIGSGNVGLSTSLQTIQDGDGNNSALELSTTGINVVGTFKINSTQLTLSSAITLNGNGNSVILGGNLTVSSSPITLVGNNHQLTLNTDSVLSGTNTGDQTITLTGAVTGSGTGSIVTTLTPGSFTFASLGNISAQRLLGNPTGSPAVTSEIDLGSTLTFSGTTLKTAAITGDVTAPLGSFSTSVGKINGVSLGTTTATSANILIGSGTAWESKAISGDITINSSGVTAIGAGKITLSNLATATKANFLASAVVQTFTATGTYTPTSGMIYCLVEGIGGGASGGSVGSTGGAAKAGSSGGGSGGYFKASFNAATIGASQAVTIGAGGAASAAGVNDGNNGSATSLGSLATANGGTKGIGNNAGGSVVYGGGGAIIGTGGIINMPGKPGGENSSSWNTNNPRDSGPGGDSFYAIGGRVTSGSAAGNIGSGYGAGGSGCSSGNSQPARSGGAGNSGVIIITEFIGG